MSVDLRVGKPEDVNMCARRIAGIKEQARTWVNGKLHSALVVIAARQGRIVLQEAFGQLSTETDSDPVRLDTVFPITSQTKMITAAAIMMLVDEARIGLHRPVIEYIPEFTGFGKAMVTIHHLLTHTSGLVDSDIDLHMIEKTGTSDLTQVIDDETEIIDAYLTSGYDAPLTWPPGQRQYYSFYAFELLGEIVARASGRSLADYARERIFAPLGMRDSWYIVPGTALDRIVTRPAGAPLAHPNSPGFEWLPAMIKPIIGTELPLFRRSPWAMGGVYSTAPDMLCFGQMLLNHGHLGGRCILSPSSAAMMTRNQIPGIGSWRGETQLMPEASYGYGIAVAEQTISLQDPDLASLNQYGHTGGGGVSLTVDPEHELVMLYYSVELSEGTRFKHQWNNDLFVDGITSAVLD